MKQIIKELPRETELVTIKEMFTHISSNSQAIIAYVTNNGTGMAVSCALANDAYGFIYHSALLKNKRHNIDGNNIKYVADTKTESMQKVLNADRQLFVFDNFKEFVEFSAKQTDNKL